MVSKKVSDINKEVFPIYNFPSLSFILLDPYKDIWMDYEQVYNMIQIGWNNLKRTQGGQIVSKTHTSFPIF